MFPHLWSQQQKEHMPTGGSSHGDGELKTNGVAGEEVMGKGMRTKYPNSRYREYVTHTIVKKKSPFSSSPSTSASSGTPYPITHFVNCERFSDNHKRYIAAITAGDPLESFKEAMRYEGRRNAMTEEIRALENQGTWVLQELPLGKKALGSKWVYTNKYDGQGNLKRLKARLVIHLPL